MVDALLLSLASLASTFQCCDFLVSRLTLQRLLQRQYIVTRANHGLAGYPTFKNSHGKIRPRLGGLPSLADQAPRHGRLPRLSCKCRLKKYKIIRTGRLPHLHVYRPLEGQKGGFVRIIICFRAGPLKPLATSGLWIL